MRNLKRALSLVMAAVMLIGMMVVSAGAVSYDEFTDKDEIVHTEAVSVLNTLNVIVGKDDGSFDPNGIVTRGEMAKIICVMLNGGEEPVLGVKSTPTFTDIKGHWAEKYIEYCVGLNVIAGRGNGKFDPDATVTGTEAAKMFLTALGYDAVQEKIVAETGQRARCGALHQPQDHRPRPGPDPGQYLPDGLQHPQRQGAEDPAQQDPLQR